MQNLELSIININNCMAMIVLAHFWRESGARALRRHDHSCARIWTRDLVELECCKAQVMEDDLICNFKKCRKRLNTVAWVTSCSRILLIPPPPRTVARLLKKFSVEFILTLCTDVFCEEDGAREFGKQATCPACKPL